MELLPAAERAALGGVLRVREAAAVQQLLLESRGAAAEGVERHHGGGGEWCGTVLKHSSLEGTSESGLIQFLAPRKINFDVQLS